MDRVRSFLSLYGFTQGDGTKRQAEAGGLVTFHSSSSPVFCGLEASPLDNPRLPSRPGSCIAPLLRGLG